MTQRKRLIDREMERERVIEDMSSPVEKQLCEDQSKTWSGGTNASHVCKLQTRGSLSQSVVWHVHASLCLETPKAYPKKRWDLHNTILYIWWVISLGST
ncbi:hypothetical protein QQF64_019193 [Cirrhinus molitorella]|uniref:Uncharacterized protein n=1 Tax=Cirrhinus molitorella TaxID=172907 RepID=A0ABR3LIB1_9TELE